MNTRFTARDEVPVADPATPDGADRVCEDGFVSSGPSPTLHVLGAGKVGRALLRQLGRRYRLLGLSDRSASVFHRDGLNAAELAAHKERGRRLAELPGAQRIDLSVLLSVTPADVVLDATATDPRHTLAAHERARSVLRGDASLALAAKDAVLHDPAWYLDPSLRHRIGVNAVLGGTGRRLQDELATLRDSCDEVTLVANATSTAVLQALEAGADHDGALAAARDQGLLESDPSLDLDGTDAAIKLCIVSAALWGHDVAPAAVPRDDVRAQDPDRLRHRARGGRTTRLVARARRDGGLCVTCESVPRASTLAVPATQVVYCYGLRDGGRRVHVGHGLGPDRTARALLEDVAALTAEVRR